MDIFMLYREDKGYIKFKQKYSVLRRKYNIQEKGLGIGNVRKQRLKHASKNGVLLVE